mmetsp:Transcript_37033/g.91166  ORF Transcript_37033/g.91166 Transcript_37033/m.91166 type:complete len:207 (-) Transcript_37033:33-653(-)
MARGSPSKTANSGRQPRMRRSFTSTVSTRICAIIGMISSCTRASASISRLISAVVNPPCSIGSVCAEALLGGASGAPSRRAGGAVSAFPWGLAGSSAGAWCDVLSVGRGRLRLRCRPSGGGDTSQSPLDSPSAHTSGPAVEERRAKSLESLRGWEEVVDEVVLSILWLLLFLSREEKSTVTSLSSPLRDWASSFEALLRRKAGMSC